MQGFMKGCRGDAWERGLVSLRGGWKRFCSGEGSRSRSFKEGKGEKERGFFKSNFVVIGMNFFFLV